MRTNIEIDDKLMAQAMEAGGFKTKREAVEAGLRAIALRKTYQGLRALRGKLHWDDSDEGWARWRSEQAAIKNAIATDATSSGCGPDPSRPVKTLCVQEPSASYAPKKGNAK